LHIPKERKVKTKTKIKIKRKLIIDEVQWLSSSEAQVGGPRQAAAQVGGGEHHCTGGCRGGRHGTSMPHLVLNHFNIKIQHPL
jgi:hypothetical protein